MIKEIELRLLQPNEGQIEGLPSNPRTIDKEKFEKLKKSLTDDPEMLQLRELLVYEYEGKYVIIGGNMRYHAAKYLKFKTLPCKIIPKETSIEKLKAITIKDNNSFGSYDWDMLANSWDSELLEDWGVDLPDDWNINDEEDKGNEAKEDDFTEEDAEKAETRVKAGEIWQLGEHRLMCGDSTKKEDVERLMGGEKADMVFTDPPYGIKIVGKDGKVGAGNIAENQVYMEVKGDETTDTAKDNFNLLSSLGFKKFILFGGNYFTDFLPFSDGWIIWDKRGNMASNNFADGEMAWCSFHTPVRIYKQIWNGMIREGESEKRVHPTQKPINLISDILNDFTKENEIILDCFGGSGSTLIACEQINRKCRMIEYEPYYCDVIIARFEKLTGKQAKKIGG